MSAYRELYTNKMLINQLNSVDYKTLLPLQLTEYGATETAIQSALCIDKIFPINNMGGQPTFLAGMIAGSVNYKRRNAKRLGKMMLHRDGINYQICNDGGLNCMGITEIVIHTRWANWVRVSFTARAAYWSATQEWGITIDNATYKYGGLVAKKSVVNMNNEVIMLRGAQGQTKNVSCYNTNEEGTYNNQYSISLLEEVFHSEGVYKLASVSAAISQENKVDNFFMKKSEFDALSSLSTSAATTSVYGYIGDLLNTKVAAGYYYIPDSDESKVYIANAQGMFTSYAVRQQQQPELTIYVDDVRETDGVNRLLVHAEHIGGRPAGDIVISTSLSYYNSSNNQMAGLDPMPATFTLTIPASSTISNEVSVIIPIVHPTAASYISISGNTSISNVSYNCVRNFMKFTI